MQLGIGGWTRADQRPSTSTTPQQARLHVAFTDALLEHRQWLHTAQCNLMHQLPRQNADEDYCVRSECGCTCGRAKLRAETNQPQLLPRPLGSMGRHRLGRLAGQSAGLAGGQAGGQMNIRGHRGGGAAGTWNMGYRHSCRSRPVAADRLGLVDTGLLCFVHHFVTGNILRFRGSRNRNLSRCLGPGQEGVHPELVEVALSRRQRGKDNSCWKGRTW